jgi:mono/diheme cytochrome c family protein
MQKTLEKDGYNTADAMSAYITKGKGRMPAYGSFISPKGNVMPAKYNAEEINDISSYVLEQSSLNWIETK